MVDLTFKVKFYQILLSRIQLQFLYVAFYETWLNILDQLGDIHLETCNIVKFHNNNILTKVSFLGLILPKKKQQQINCP